MSLPADRSHVSTEQRNLRSEMLHSMSVAECLGVMAREDRQAVEAVERAEGALEAFISAAEPGFVAGGRLVYIGAGTSGRLGVLDSSEAPPTFQVEPGRVVGIIAGGDGALRRSSEGMEDDPRGAVEALEELRLGARDAVLGIAAGGTTPYVLGALSHLAKMMDGPVTGLLSCAAVDPEGLGYARPRHLIVLETGPEVIAGSTRLKAGTATKLALNMISTTLMVRAGKVYRNLMVDVRATNEKLRDRAIRIVMELTGLARGDANALLERADWSVKPAIVMQRLGVGFGPANQLLERARGRLGEVIDGAER